MTTYRQPLFALAALLCAGGATLAQQPPKAAREAALGGGTGSGPTLSRDQLRNCLIEQDALKTTREALARDTQQIDAEKADIKRAGEALKEQLDKVDRSNEEAVKMHLEQAQAHDQRIDQWNAKVAPVNERVAALQKRSERYKGDCADRRYKEDDLILLQARKQVPPGAK